MLLLAGCVFWMERNSSQQQHRWTLPGALFNSDVFLMMGENIARNM